MLAFVKMSFLLRSCSSLVWQVPRRSLHLVRHQVASGRVVLPPLRQTLVLTQRHQHADYKRGWEDSIRGAGEERFLGNMYLHKHVYYRLGT